MPARGVIVSSVHHAHFVARVVACKTRWCVPRLVLIAAAAVLEAVALVAAATNVMTDVVMTLILILLKALLASSKAVWLRRQRAKLLELRGVGNSRWRTQLAVDKHAWLMSNVLVSSVCISLAMLYMMSLVILIQQPCSASAIETQSRAGCPLTGIRSVMLALNALQTLESLVDSWISSALGYEDVFPGVSGLLQLVVRVVKHDSLDDPSGTCDTARACAICLEDFVEGESLGEMECRHRFHEECVQRWLRAGGSCPFRCSTVPAAT